MVLRPLSDLSVRPGGVAQLKLIVDALPPPSVSWYRDGQRLSPRPDAPYTVSEDGGVCVLTLPRAHPGESLAREDPGQGMVRLIFSFNEWARGDRGTWVGSTIVFFIRCF